MSEDQLLAMLTNYRLDYARLFKGGASDEALTQYEYIILRIQNEISSRTMLQRKAA